MTRPPTFNRGESLAALAEGRFDVLIVGGGITGAGVALDAAARGLRTALVERLDFASGTSSRSSKLVHGGLRYLQQREVGLVYENLAERQRLLENAPHLVKPLPFLIPLFGNDGVVNAAVTRAYSAALWTYDLTGGLRIGRRHRRVSARQVAAHFPTVRTERLVAGFLYFDAQADDARLTLTIARTAALDHGAVMANYAPVISVRKGPDGRVRGAVVDARDTGEIEVSGASLVNATGVWADEVRLLDEGPGTASLRPAKGVHLTVSQDKLPCDIAAVLPVSGDNRSIFVIPWGDEVYIGTTDTDYEGPLDDPKCEPSDMDYVLSAINRFVTEPLKPADVTATWAGLRPLLADKPGASITERTADLSRRHHVGVSSSGVVTVTGGKLTTYRKMAADTVDAVVGQLGFGSRRSPTKKLALHGAAGWSDLDTEEAALRVGAPVPAMSHLVSRYGSEARQVWELAQRDPVLAEPMVEGLPYLGAEAVWAARAEMAQTLEDVLSRRTRALLHDQARTAAAAEHVASLIAPVLGWSDRRAKEEAAALRRTDAQVGARTA